MPTPANSFAILFQNGPCKTRRRASHSLSRVRHPCQKFSTRRALPISVRSTSVTDIDPPVTVPSDATVISVHAVVGSGGWNSPTPTRSLPRAAGPTPTWPPRISSPAPSWSANTPANAADRSSAPGRTANAISTIEASSAESVTGAYAVKCGSSKTSDISPALRSCVTNTQRYEYCGDT
jgi:hypothetical protein